MNYGQCGCNESPATRPYLEDRSTLQGARAKGSVEVAVETTVEPFRSEFIVDQFLRLIAVDHRRVIQTPGPTNTSGITSALSRAILTAISSPAATISTLPASMNTVGVSRQISQVKSAPVTSWV
jgi:hypothetical protein